MRTLPLWFVVLAACSAYDSDLGPTPFLCGEAEPRCPDDYTCQDDITTGQQVCVGGGGSLNNDFDCTDDSQFEPNNMLDVASPTTIDAMDTFSQGNLSICPANDKDLFAMTLTSPASTVELVIEFQANGATLAGAILNAGGVPIVTATADASDPYKARATVSNLPAGTYYAQVAASIGGVLTLNNYNVSLTASGQ
jgi:hypothetical protein